MNKIGLKRIKMSFLSLLLVVVLLTGTVGFGWFMMTAERTADTEALKIEKPPILYILDSDAKDMTQLSLSGLEIGKEKKLVFCVSSVYPIASTSRGYKTDFSLELIYTKNLYADFNLYPADIKETASGSTMDYISQYGTHNYFDAGATPLTYTDVSEKGNISAYNDNFNDTYSKVQKNNQAIYKKFLISYAGNDSLCFTADNGKTGEFNTLNCRYFVLDISWPSDFAENSIDAKETDMVYILARGGGA